jgi:hypothetical protein
MQTQMLIQMMKKHLQLQLKAAKPIAGKKVEDVASAFNDLFNNL